MSETSNPKRRNILEFSWGWLNITAATEYVHQVERKIRAGLCSKQGSMAAVLLLAAPKIISIGFLMAVQLWLEGWAMILNTFCDIGRALLRR
ncbi:hypothetical protein HNP46_006754 [Pseudomonas nitritireducens]|uniref:Uncharacterized protein n=1 Tax=Pseudomonas nitroreducens TaxID=46680 RepID=A0A7W7KRX3_PSENT|nr:hypothetical protein [Pseudomonas nitritireducens]MBB4867835.1 hypothetical protein [Pseudomonas nitritireducens]